MKNRFVFLVTLIALAAIGPLWAASAKDCQVQPQTVPTRIATEPTTTFNGIIIKINLAADLVVIKDEKGKIWEFTVNPKTINLSAYKVGQKVTATVSDTAAASDPDLRARMSKQQLLRLQ